MTYADASDYVLLAGLTVSQVDKSQLRHYN